MEGHLIDKCLEVHITVNPDELESIIDDMTRSWPDMKVGYSTAVRTIPIANDTVKLIFHLDQEWFAEHTYAGA